MGTAAAVVNAVYHATGIRVRDLPVPSTNCCLHQPVLSQSEDPVDSLGLERFGGHLLRT